MVSIGYLALVDYAQTAPMPDELSEECRWWEMDQRPQLVMDHDRIVTHALETLRAGSYYLPIGAELLPERFTMPELQRLHEAVLGRALDRRNSQRRMRRSGLVERLPERRTGGTHRAPYLYRFRASATDA